MRSLLVAVLFVVACGDEPVKHLPDAPPGLDAILDFDGPPADVSLHVTKDGTGTGTVGADGLSCGATCDANLPPGTVLTLTAVADDSSTFTGWGGACTGTTPTCEVTLAQATTVNATFTLKTFAVTVTKAGAGTGTITGGAIACGSTCTATVDYGTSLTLTAAPANLSVFAGWGGACSGTADCTVTVTADTDITANFALNDATLFVSLGGNGAGKVTSAPAGIDCGATCQHTYSAGDMVTLTAAPSTGSTFTGWSGGGCTGTAACTVTLTSAATVTATFTLQTFALTVAKTGTGSGAIASTPAGIACGTACTHAYTYGTMVALTATPSTGSHFVAWTGACTGAGACTVTMDAAKTVTAQLALDQEALTVAVTGNGTVTGGGLTCTSNCTGSQPYGSVVTLTATPGAGSTFAGWGGACTGTGACTLTMDAAKSVTAAFTVNTYSLTVMKTGTGAGTVSGGMISCGATCSETVAYNTMVTLTAAPATGSTFGGWSGACSGTGSCIVTITAATAVTATFIQQMFPLTVTKVGSGTVTGGGIACGATCTEDLAYGTAVTLTAAPASGYTFAGWSGACTGTGTCSVTMTAARNVTATFVANVTLTVAKTGTGSGTVTGGSITCGATCTQTVPPGTMITLTAVPSPAIATLSRFAGWSGGGCTGTGTCTVTVSAATTVTAAFTLAPNIAFATSSVQSGALNGLAGADKICQTLADSVHLGGTYVAYLSQATAAGVITNAPSRVGSATGWVRTDGKPVANDIAQMAPGALFNPIILDESGNDASTKTTNVWTNTRSDGTAFGTNTDQQCYNGFVPFAPWTGAQGYTMYGNIAVAIGNKVVADDADQCSYEMHLYCFGIDRKAIAQ